MGKRSGEEIKALLKGYEGSGLTRSEYCGRVGIPVSTLDYYRHRASLKKPVKLVRVKVQPAPASGTFTLVLVKGRRIKSTWNFSEAELARLIRIVEGA